MDTDSAIKRFCVDNIAAKKALAIVDRMISIPCYETYSLRFSEMESIAEYE